MYWSVTVIVYLYPRLLALPPVGLLSWHFDEGSPLCVKKMDKLRGK
ncbi:hypothetical protein YPPY66_4130 [Yersinia pestis PY-66]|nr:hypothetical protein YpAngola_A0946 [Yersinia pestis Angola]EDR50308.1 hypothetical protein YpB42003004_3549 [Yersinia pestis biovar Antiqua str. B42003004]EDR67096.1 hypothetical protein YpK1973002_2292 [Yersinia pestis biovar Mediaevalis str. K1973002]EIQ85628.1 hypothetical protein YPPY02_3804 [Yersinia pestis PY-02]EIQ99785.1 hypothetical protein YPPY05_3794 [Yersinia pestis PY-05]EIR16559.1 hypothetical protein YPPY09_3853 [Yersinia pestis PY-09]EIR29423.1 hypothetical protein YPPY11_